jgi:hypothetical protein
MPLASSGSTFPKVGVGGLNGMYKYATRVSLPQIYGFKE